MIAALIAACRVGAHLRCVAAVFVALALIVVMKSPAIAVPPPASGFNTNDAILRWINEYRRRPDPDRLPAVVHALSAMQAFKAAESSGPYVGFIAGVLGTNAARAPDLIVKMLVIDPADQWVLVRAIAYSGLPNWRELLATFVDRMATRRAMIDKIKSTLHIGKEQKKAVVLQPTPELIDVLWGYYLATGSYVPIERVIKLLPLSNDHENVDNLTTGSAAKFTLASNAVRDADLLAMLKWADKNQPKEVKVVLDDVIETAETVDTVHMRQESLAAIEELKTKGPNSKRELSGWGQIGQGALSMGCVVAAATGQIELGLPCVVGGAAYTAGVQYMTH